MVLFGKLQNISKTQGIKFTNSHKHNPGSPYWGHGVCSMHGCASTHIPWVRISVCFDWTTSVSASLCLRAFYPSLQLWKVALFTSSRLEVLVNNTLPQAAVNQRLWWIRIYVPQFSCLSLCGWEGWFWSTGSISFSRVSQQDQVQLTH